MNTLKQFTSNVCKAIGLLRKLNYRLPRSSLTKICKSFVRHYLNYVDIRLIIIPFSKDPESIEYKALLTEADQGLLQHPRLSAL